MLLNLSIMLLNKENVLFLFLPAGLLYDVTSYLIVPDHKLKKKKENP